MNHLVFQSDFGLVDGAVSAMYGVAYTVEPRLNIHDLTHDITPYNIWEASYRLIQTIRYWPQGTIFVSVVDPGVGSDRKSVVVKTASGHYVVTPDNGTLTHIIRFDGIEAVREIDEHVNRLPRSGESYTFHGRDVFAYTGARLAAGIIDFEGVGPEMKPEDLVRLPIIEPRLEGSAVCGTIDVLDVRFGSLWTNIPRTLFLQTGVHYGDRVSITIENDTRCVYPEHYSLRQELCGRVHGRGSGLCEQPGLYGGSHQPGQLRTGPTISEPAIPGESALPPSRGSKSAVLAFLPE